jgi:endoglucanase
VWAREATGFADEVTSDQHGNVYAWVNRGGKPRVMLAGHLDEIGLMVSHIDEKGFIYFSTIGGWDSQILQGQRVCIQSGSRRVSGVIGKKPIHRMKPEERKKVVQVDDMWIDIGARSGKDARRYVSIGDPVVMAYKPEELKNDFMVSRAMDDKAGAFVILEAARLLARRKINAEVVAVATVQEEVGLRGAVTSTYTVDPDVGIAVDLTFASDFPSMDHKSGKIEMGQGAVVPRGPNINPVLFDLLAETARKNRIKYQVEPAPRGTGTDANRIQLTRAGVATAIVSIPNRYMHSPCEMVHRRDLDAAVRLIAAAVARMTEKTNFGIGI